MRYTVFLFLASCASLPPYQPRWHNVAPQRISCHLNDDRCAEVAGAIDAVNAVVGHVAVVYDPAGNIQLVSQAGAAPLGDYAAQTDGHTFIVVYGPALYLPPHQFQCIVAHELLHTLGYPDLTTGASIMNASYVMAEGLDHCGFTPWDRRSLRQ